MLKIFDPNTTYVGVAYKHGGGIFARFDNVNGRIFRLDAPHLVWDFTQLNVSIGIGVGGGISTAIVFAFNCPNPYVMNNKDVGRGDWSVDVSTGKKWDAIVKVFKAARYITTLAKLAKFGVEGVDDMATLISWTKDIYQATGAAHSNETKFLSIGIPGAGVGLECFVSVCLQGKLELTGNAIDLRYQRKEQCSRGYDGARGHGNHREKEQGSCGYDGSGGRGNHQRTEQGSHGYDGAGGRGNRHRQGQGSRGYDGSGGRGNYQRTEQGSRGYDGAGGRGNY